MPREMIMPKHLLNGFAAFLLCIALSAPQPATAGPGSSDKDAGRYVLFDTTDGDILVELFPDDAPLTVANFIRYVEDGFYDETTFHRVIKDFVVQGGGYTPAFDDKETRDPVRNESRNRIRNDRGTIAMARGDSPHSATSQFYFNLKDNHGLDWDGMYGGYTVFGTVVLGMDVVDDIALIPTGPGPEDAEVVFDRDVPFRPVYIRKARLLDDKEASAMLDSAATEPATTEE